MLTQCLGQAHNYFAYIDLCKSADIVRWTVDSILIVRGPHVIIKEIFVLLCVSSLSSIVYLPPGEANEESGKITVLCVSPHR